MKKILMMTAAGFALVAGADAAVVSVDLTNIFGFADASDNSSPQSVANFDLFGDGTVTTTITISASADIQAETGTSGGGGLGVVGGANDQVNPGETFTISFSNFGGSSAISGVQLVSLRSGYDDGIGANLDGDAGVSFTGVLSGTAPTIITGTNVQQTAIAGDVVLGDGGSVTFTGDIDDGSFRVSGITIDTVVVPEPSSTALLGLGGLALLLRRRK
jgi:hypothetical protein